MSKNKQISVIYLPERTVAIVSHGRIVFGINASKQEIDSLINEECMF